MAKQHDIPKGVHTVRSGGNIYRYAWRGGPRLLAPVGTEAFHVEYAAALQERRRPPIGDLDMFITEYLQSPDFQSLSTESQRNINRHLSEIRVKFGALTQRALEDVGVRAVFMDYRDEHAKHPRAADSRIEALRLPLSHAVRRGRLSLNNAAGIPKLYKSKRAHIIWSDEEIADLKNGQSVAFGQAVDFACMTGLRQGDLIRIPWEADKGNRLDWITSKTGRRVMVPIIPELRAFLDALPRHADTILTNAINKPWSPSNLRNTMTKAKKGKSYEDKHFHDLRGTFVTKLIRKGLSDERVGDVVGWNKHRVKEIRRVYVEHDAIMESVIRTLTDGGV